MIGWKRAAAWHVALVAIIALSSTSAAIVAGATIGLFWAMTARALQFVKHPVLLWLGAISYPLYLIHQYVGYVLIDQFAGAGLPLLAATTIALVLVTCLAHLLHIWVEEPAQRHLRVARRSVPTPAE
jgi:peptidoglycan/LPS O-acetylase OafA/YrhL